MLMKPSLWSPVTGIQSPEHVIHTVNPCYGLYLPYNPPSDWQHPTRMVQPPENAPSKIASHKSSLISHAMGPVWQGPVVSLSTKYRLPQVLFGRRGAPHQAPSALKPILVRASTTLLAWSPCSQGHGSTGAAIVKGKYKPPGGQGRTGRQGLQSDETLYSTVCIRKSSTLRQDTHLDLESALLDGASGPELCLELLEDCLQLRGVRGRPEATVTLLPPRPAFATRTITHPGGPRREQPAMHGGKHDKQESLSYDAMQEWSDRRAGNSQPSVRKAALFQAACIQQHCVIPGCVPQEERERGEVAELTLSCHWPSLTRPRLSLMGAADPLELPLAPRSQDESFSFSSNP